MAPNISKNHFIGVEIGVELLISFVDVGVAIDSLVEFGDYGLAEYAHTASAFAAGFAEFEFVEVEAGPVEGCVDGFGEFLECHSGWYTEDAGDVAGLFDDGGEVGDRFG